MLPPAGGRSGPGRRSEIDAIGQGDASARRTRPGGDRVPGTHRTGAQADSGFLCFPGTRAHVRTDGVRYRQVGARMPGSRTVMCVSSKPRFRCARRHPATCVRQTSPAPTDRTPSGRRRDDGGYEPLFGAARRRCRVLLASLPLRPAGTGSTDAEDEQMPVKPVPDGYTTAAPYLFVRGGKAAIDFYRRAFGATRGRPDRDARRAPGPCRGQDRRHGRAPVRRAADLRREGAGDPGGHHGRGLPVRRGRRRRRPPGGRGRRGP